ncbi:MAG: M67 family metallopeptidase [Cyanobacteria bacterium P01_A01_bin.114]
MALTLNSNHIAAMQTHAERTYPDECCGLMLGCLNTALNEKELIELRPLKNAWSPGLSAEFAARSQTLSDLSKDRTQTSRYWIDPQDLLAVQREARQLGLDIIGVYHSHPDHLAVPSECDRALAWPEYSYIIMSVQNGAAVDIQIWQLDADHQFQPEPMKIAPASAATDRMCVASSW